MEMWTYWKPINKERMCNGAVGGMRLPLRIVRVNVFLDVDLVLDGGKLGVDELIDGGVGALGQFG